MSGAEGPGRRPGSRGAAGFSLFELVVVVCIVAVLAAAAAERLTVVRAMAERGALEFFIGNLRSAAGMRVASYVAKGQLQEISKIGGANPVDWLAQVPENYQGAFYGINPVLVDPGQWYFDSKDRMLVYRVRYSDYFESPLPGPARARFAVVLVYDTPSGSRPETGEAGRATGIRISAVERYRWVIPGG